MYTINVDTTDVCIQVSFSTWVSVFGCMDISIDTRVRCERLRVSAWCGIEGEVYASNIMTRELILVLQLRI